MSGHFAADKSGTLVLITARNQLNFWLTLSDNGLTFILTSSQSKSLGLTITAN